MDDLKQLSADEKTAYLANVLSIAKADGATHAMEATVLKAVMERLDARGAELQAARQLLGSGSYRLRLMRQPRHRMAGMEDMVLMSLADGELADAEAQPIEKLCSLYRLTQADVNIMIKRAKTRLHELKANAARPTTPKQPPARPERAQPAPPPPLPTPDAPVPPPVPSAEPAKASTPPPVQEPKRTLEPESNPEPEPEREPGHESKREQEAGPEEDERKEAPATWTACAQQREAASAPDEYCFGIGGPCMNTWGCRLAKMNWEQDADWFTLGEFRVDGTFIFDKAAIRETLKEQLGDARDCPHFRSAYAEAAVARLPSKADVNGRWEYRRCAAEAPNARPLRVRDYVHGCAVHASVVTNGVSPTSTRDAVITIQRAAKCCEPGPLDAAGNVTGTARHVRRSAGRRAT